MKKNLNVLILLFLFVVLTSCAPQSKDSYLKEYQKFILNVKNECENYSEGDWLRADKKFIVFSEELYGKFEQDLTWKESLLLSKHEVKYQFLKFKHEFSSISEIFKDENIGDLKKQIKFYSENGMEDDIEFVRKQALEVGDEAVSEFEVILKELELYEE